MQFVHRDKKLYWCGSARDQIRTTCTAAKVPKYQNYLHCPLDSPVGWEPEPPHSDSDGVMWLRP